MKKDFWLTVSYLFILASALYFYYTDITKGIFWAIILVSASIMFPSIHQDEK